MGGKSKVKFSTLEVYAVSLRVQMNRGVMMTGKRKHSWMKADLKQVV